jgi:hypothetical protein
LQLKLILQRNNFFNKSTTFSTTFLNFATYNHAFIEEWPKKKQHTYAQIADKTRPNGWANARRADNGTLMWSKW